MRLKSIEIIGFKSFADKITVHFLQGITVIVGPNGCGKSNIADAFRWVLGEQSAKSMRGSKMPDVIFAGTATRKPLNFAEVTVTLCEIEGALPVDYEEVAVTRRLHRNGESEYFINRQPVRLKDVQSLFLDSGMGKDAYSIFEQGKIDQVINFTPLERRYIFEEAAGILRFLQRKREALRKLELSNQNISRVKDIHLEVEKQIVVLEKQAEKAKIFKENKSKLEVLEKGVLLAKWEALAKRMEEGSKKEGDLKNGIHLLNIEIEKLLYTLQEAKDHLTEGEKAFRARSEEVYKARSEKEIKSREKLHSQERIKEAVNKEKRWRQELEEMLLKRTKRQSESQQAQKQQKGTEAELSTQEAVLKEMRSKVQALEVEVAFLRDKQQAAQRELMQLMQKESQAESELKQTVVRLESHAERKTQLQERKQRLVRQQEEGLTAVQEKQKALQEVSNTIDGQKVNFNALEATLSELQKGIQETQGVLETLHRDLAEARARQKVLLKMREEMEGYSPSSKKLLQESANPKSPFFKKITGLYEWITPKPGHETAIAAVMRPYAHTLAVESEGDLHQVLAFAKQHQLRDFSLFCLQHANVEKGSLQGWTSLVDRAVEHTATQHFLKGVYAADQLSRAFEASKGTFWLEEGYVYDNQRVLFYTTPGAHNVFVREAELKLLEAKIQEGETARLEADAKLKVDLNTRSKLFNERVELDKTIRKTEMSLVEVNFALQRLKGDLDKSKAEAGGIDQEIATVQAAIDKFSTHSQTLQEQSKSAKAQLSEKQKGGQELQNALEKQLSTLKGEIRLLQEKEALVQRIADENRKSLHALHVLEVKDLESLQQEKRLEEEIRVSRELQAEIKTKTGEYEQMLQEVDKLLTEVTHSCSDLEKEVARRKKGIEGIDAQLLDLRAKLKKQEGDLYQAGIQTAQVDSSRQNIESELFERYGLQIEAVRTMGVGLDKTVDQAEKQLRALRSEIDSAGDINMTSIEEFEKHKTRYEFLNQQIGDMNLSKEELIAIIGQLDSESRKIFQETFDKVRANFVKNFKILFNGGEADLQFTETADVLEAGIEIIARPPGKQMRSINLMSGGEKCLTAMALLFAIFEVKPAPYCILDEIDAPLDDTNVDRFVNVVKQFIDRCQFIIISHNKRTMAMGDVLLGVSMEEKGVSKMLSIEFERAVQMVQ